MVFFVSRSVEWQELKLVNRQEMTAARTSTCLGNFSRGCRRNCSEMSACRVAFIK